MNLLICRLNQTLIVGLVLFNDAEHDLLFLQSDFLQFDLINQVVNDCINLVSRQTIKLVHQRGILGRQRNVRVLDDQKSLNVVARRFIHAHCYFFY